MLVVCRHVHSSSSLYSSSTAQTGTPVFWMKAAVRCRLSKGPEIFSCTGAVLVFRRLKVKTIFPVAVLFMIFVSVFLSFLVFDKTVFRPDITVMVDWALKSNNQSINLSLFVALI